jgi:hypothetical protein
MIDRKCPRCGCWWRVDTRFIRASEGEIFHAADWTQIGTISEKSEEKS